MLRTTLSKIDQGGRRDAGIALPTVLLSMLVLTAFALAALAFVVQSAPANRTTADAKGALAAAQAGVDEYTSRLNGKPTYYTAVDPTNLAFTRRGNGAPFTDGRDPRGALVPGTTDAYFSYVVLTRATTTARDGIIRVRVTGNASGQTKSLTASYGVDGLLKYIYLTDVETLYPLLFADQQTPSTRDAYLHHCERHWYDDPEGTGRWSNSFTYEGKPYNLACTDIQFTANDVIRGRLHSNDALNVGGNATFEKPVTTYWTTSNNPKNSLTRPWRGTGTPRVTTPKIGSNVSLPTSNVKLRAQSQVPGVGCQYTGETSFIFAEDSVKVLSPNTVATTSPECFDVTKPGQEQTIKPIPEVMFVANGTSCSRTRVTYLQSDQGASLGGTTTLDDCKAGNAFVSGKLLGRVTVAAENDIVVTGNTTYAGGLGGDDVLGLVPNNYVWVYHPVEKVGNSIRDVGGKQVTRIDAAILSLQRSFLVQNWNLGGKESPTLTVNGAIAQKFRGPVGLSDGSGYTKNYVYDARLQNLPPPYFLTPEEAPWVVKRLTDG